MRLTWDQIFAEPACVCGRAKAHPRMQTALCERCRHQLPRRLRWKIDTAEHGWLVRWWRLGVAWLRRSGEL